VPRILIVDDEPLNLDLLRARLLPRGYELVEAGDGAQAVALAEAASPDLVLLDIRMPGMDGLEACRRMKRSAEARKEYLPVVLLTAHEEASVRREGLEAGADEFLSKPFDATELGLRIRNLVALRSDRATVQQQNARLLELQRFKEEMSALIVHDLKNPAAVTLSNLDFISSALDDGTPTDVIKEALDDAQDSCRRSLRLLVNLLDVARAEDHRLSVHREPLALSAVVWPLLQSRQSAARLRDLHIEAELDPDAIAPIDADLVARVIENVLDNALRYTPKGGLVRLVVKREGDDIQVRIGNTGKPIPAEARTLIFEKYGQLRAVSVQGLSRGLGLYFCRLATEAHGGKIWVEEDDDLATVFVVSLPA